MLRLICLLIWFSALLPLIDAALCDQRAPDDCYFIDVSQSWNGNGDFALKSVWQQNIVDNVWTFKAIPNVVHAIGYTETLPNGSPVPVPGIPTTFVSKATFFTQNG
jgi:hypothetical protein